MNGRVLVLYREQDRMGPYRDALLQAGAHPELLLPGQIAAASPYSGLLLTGGSDVDPALYGAERHPETEEADTERDLAEYTLLVHAIRHNLPVLAICRGMQLLNVFHGGTLIQHIEPPERHRRAEGDRSLPVHATIIQDESILRRIVGGPELPVNSRHHQGIARLGSQLRVVAHAPEDGMIEAVEHVGSRFVLGVQWHPEDQVARFAAQAAIFAAFAEACRTSAATAGY